MHKRVCGLIGNTTICNIVQFSDAFQIQMVNLIFIFMTTCNAKTKNKISRPLTSLTFPEF